jgi:hypothetical protein
VGHLLSDSGLLDGSNRVTSSNDGDASLGGEGGELVGNSDRSLGELGELKDTHGAVPDHSLGVIKGLVEDLNGLGANVESHPSVGDGVDVDDLVVGIGVKLVSDDNVHGEEELNSLGLGHGLELDSELKLVVLNEGVSNLEATSLVKGEDHASSNDDLVGSLEEGLDDRDLGGDLGASDDSNKRLLGGLDGTLEVVELLLEEEARDRGLEEVGNTLSGGVGAVGSAEGVVDVEVGVRSELLGELGCVLLLLLVEADILEEDELRRGGKGREGSGPRHS